MAFFAALGSALGGSSAASGASAGAATGAGAAGAAGVAEGAGAAGSALGTTGAAAAGSGALTPQFLAGAGPQSYLAGSSTPGPLASTLGEHLSNFGSTLGEGAMNVGRGILNPQRQFDSSPKGFGDIVQYVLNNNLNGYLTSGIGRNVSNVLQPQDMPRQRHFVPGRGFV